MKISQSLFHSILDQGGWHNIKQVAACVQSDSCRASNALKENIIPVSLLNKRFNVDS
jgi:hypothetical protein